MSESTLKSQWREEDILALLDSGFLASGAKE
jgi:hypothetical protein